MAKSDKRWLATRRRDRFVSQAQRQGLRSRAAFKLEEIDRRHGLFRPGQRVIDLGAAPGSWSAYAAARVGPAGQVIAIDRLALRPIEGVTFLQGDASDETLWRNALKNGKAGLVISDLAPNLSGIAATDQANSLRLAETALGLAEAALEEGGHLLVKLFQGPDNGPFKAALQKSFASVTLCKPRASRADSRELYALAKRYHG